MSKSIFYRLFGLGRIPPKRLAALEEEGIVLVDEGIGGSFMLRDFRAPRHRYGRKVSSFAGSLVLTRTRFVAFTFYPSFNPIIDVELDGDRLADLECSVDRGQTLRIRFDPARLHEEWSGDVECRFRTLQAGAFLEHLQSRETSS